MIDLKPWMLPLLVVGLLAPIGLGLALLGPQGMVFAALLVGLALMVAVSLPGRGRPIEVASGGAGRRHLLVAALAPVAEMRVAEAIAAHAGEREHEVLVVAPALNPTLDHWAADVAGARARAQEVLDASLGRLARAGLAAQGSVGDPNPALAVEDALREFPADAVVVVAGAEGDDGLADELRERLDRPVEELGNGARASG